MHGTIEDYFYEALRGDVKMPRRFPYQFIGFTRYRATGPYTQMRIPHGFSMVTKTEITDAIKGLIRILFELLSFFL